MVEVLISSMHLRNLEIVSKTGITTDALIINQTNENSTTSCKKQFGLIRCISTTERGLSRSRNMAIRNAKGKYCLICDDDEELDSDYPRKIIKAFREHPDAGVICFCLDIEGKHFSKKSYKINYITALKVSSVQMSLNIPQIRDANILFDEKFGSGTEIGSGEENIFLYDCLKKGIPIYYVPVHIGKVIDNGSQWFKGFNIQYFINRGIIIRKLMGRLIGFLYCIYFTFTKQKLYKNEMDLFSATKYILYGLLCNR